MKKKSKDKLKGKWRIKNKNNSFLEKILSYLNIIIHPTDEQISEFKSNINKANIIKYGTFLFLFLLLFFQYKYERGRQLKGINDQNMEDSYFEILGLDKNSDLKAVRKQYKKLAKIWHPDKHPNCKNCKEKFEKITTAHEELVKMLSNGNDKSINREFSKNVYYLNLKNYHKLVEKSNDFWVIFIYQSNYNYQTYASVFTEVADKYASVIKFGVIDVLKEESLLVYLPFKFPILPKIYSHSTTGENEIFQNMEILTPTKLITFIENSFYSSVELVKKNKIELFAKENKTKINIKQNHRFSYNDLDVKFFILTPFNYIDLIVKDFNQRYGIPIIQNDLGFFSDGIKIFNPKENRKMFIGYNKINLKENIFERTIEEIPVSFNLNEDHTRKLQIGFEMSKRLMKPKIYKNNFIKHCSNKIEIIRSKYNSKIDLENEEENNRNQDICVIDLKDNISKDLEREYNLMEKNLLEKLILNFEAEKTFFEKRRKNKENVNTNDNFYIINYGYTELKKNKNLYKLYKDYLNQHNDEIKEDTFSKGRKFLIINLTQEKFIFKSFNNIKDFERFSELLIDNNLFEDFTLGFEYLQDYNINDIKNLFAENKSFSVIQILKMSIYAQEKVVYVITFVFLFLSGIYILGLKSHESLVRIIY